MSKQSTYKAYLENETDPAVLQGLSAMQRSKLARLSVDIERQRKQYQVVEAAYAEQHKLVELTVNRRKELVGQQLEVDDNALRMAAVPTPQVDHDLTSTQELS